MVKLLSSIHFESSSTCRKKKTECDQDNDLYTKKTCIKENSSVKISKAYASSKRRMHLLVSSVLLSY